MQLSQASCPNPAAQHWLPVPTGPVRTWEDATAASFPLPMSPHSLDLGWGGHNVLKHGVCVYVCELRSTAGVIQGDCGPHLRSTG
jgi:hypothetical protein